MDGNEQKNKLIFSSSLRYNITDFLYVNYINIDKSIINIFTPIACFIYYFFMDYKNYTEEIKFSFLLLIIGAFLLLKPLVHLFFLSVKQKKYYQNDKNIFSSQVFISEDNYINLINPYVELTTPYHSIKNIKLNNRYFLMTFKYGNENLFLYLPRKRILEGSVDHFYESLRKDKIIDNSQVGILIISIILAVLALIPFLGIFFAIALFLLFVFGKKYKLFYILAIMLSLLSSYTLYNYSDKVVKQLQKSHRKELSTADKSNLKRIIKEIEYYRNINLHYPKNLTEIIEFNRKINPDGLINFNDNDSRGYRIYYRLINANSYELFSVGEDGKPHTEDDILTDLALTEINNTGLANYNLIK